MKLKANKRLRAWVLGGAFMFLTPQVNSYSVSVTSQVYICYSTTAKRYHYKSNCRGLTACTHRIIKVSKSEAKKMGRTLCKWED